MNTKHLCDLCCGEKATVTKISLTGAMLQRLLDIGLVKNTAVECVGSSPSGDPSAYLIRGAIIALRQKDSRHIDII